MLYPLRQLLLIALVCSSAAGFAAKAPKKIVKKKVVKKAPVRKAASARSISGIEGDLGVLPPLGFFDPLGLSTRGPVAYRRFQELEIKHGRLAMAGCLGVIVTEAGIRFPGYLSISQDIKFEDVGGGLSDAYFTVPLAGWAQ